jgi:hypothetical protein
VLVLCCLAASGCAGDPSTSDTARPDALECEVVVLGDSPVDESPTVAVDAPADVGMEDARNDAEEVAPDAALDVIVDVYSDEGVGGSLDASLNGAMDVAIEVGTDAVTEDSEAPDVLTPETRCAPGQVVCDVRCVDTSAHNAHCGVCSNACSPGNSVFR